MLTDEQKRLIEFNDMSKTLTYFEKNQILDDINMPQIGMYNAVFPVLTQYVISPVASIIYGYYTLNEDQRRLLSLRNVYLTFSRSQKEILRGDMLFARSNSLNTVFNALPAEFTTDISNIIYDYSS